MCFLTLKRPESVLIVVYRAGSEILLLQRRDRPDFWQSVTGSMQPEENNPLVSAWRELEEETTLKHEDGQMYDCQCQWWFDIYPYWQHRYAKGVTRNLEHVFCFEVTSSKVIKMSQEHLSFQWVPIERAIQKVASPTNQEAILKFVPFEGLDEKGK